MTAVWMRFRIELRARWRGWLALALLAGLAGGLVIAAAAGARRTESTLARHLEAFSFPDATILRDNIISENDGSYFSGTIASVRSLPQVAASAVTAELAYCARDRQNVPVGVTGPRAVVFTVNVDGRYGNALRRPKLLAGRLADPNRPNEVLLDSRAAGRFGVGPGAVIPIRVFPSWNPGVFTCDPRNAAVPQRGIPTRREVRQILLACTTAIECRKRKPLADRLYRQLRDGASFSPLERRYSDYENATGGRYWSPDPETPPAFTRVALALRLREVSHPFRTMYGWHIVQPLTAPVPGGPLIRLRVTGVAATTDPYPIGAATLTPAFHDRYWSASRYASYSIAVRLRHGAADIPALERAAGADALREADDAAKIQPTIDHQAEALWLAAAFGGLLALVLLAPALLRLATSAAAAHPTLRTLGMTRAQLVATATARAAVIGAAAASVAVGITFGASPLTPIGLARDLEPDPGFRFDGGALGIGAAGVFLAVVLGGVVAGALVTRRRTERGRRRGSAAEALARWGLPPSAVTGVRLALTRAGGTAAVPTAGALVGAVAAVAVVAVAVTFSASLGHLLSTPLLYGQNWDYRTNYAVPSAAHVLADPAIGDAARGEEATVSLNGRRIIVSAMDDMKGAIGPVVTEGRRPEGADEIVVSPKTLDALGLGIGDSVEARRGSRSIDLRITGRGIFPESVCNCPRARAATTFQTLRRLDPHARPVIFEARAAPDADRRATVQRLERAYIHPAPGEPRTLADFQGIHRLPVVVSTLLALIAAAALSYTLVAAVRRRRRQLAVLKTIGFDRRQLLATVTWQALTFAAIGLLIGLPVGLAAGRWVWYLFAEQIDVVPAPVTPAQLVLLVPATLLVAVAVALLPGWSAARTRAALVLRAE